MSRKVFEGVDRPALPVAQQRARDAEQRFDLLGAVVMAHELDLGPLEGRGIGRARLDRGGEIEYANRVTLSRPRVVSRPCTRIAADCGSGGRPLPLMVSNTDAIRTAQACR